MDPGTFLGHFIFIILQKKSFGLNIFWISCSGSKVLAIFQFWQNCTFEPMHEIQKLFWPKDFFWSIMKMAFTKNIPSMSQGRPNPGFKSVRVEIEILSKRISKILFNLGSYEYLARLECKIRMCVFFHGSLL